MAGTILVADDSATMRMIVQATLCEAGWQVALANDGQRAFDLARVQAFDLVVTDWNMPIMGGAELVAALRAHASTVALPVLVLTTEGDQAAVNQGEALGVNGWLSKPLEPAMLIAAVRSLLEEPA